MTTIIVLLNDLIPYLLFNMFKRVASKAERYTLALLLVGGDAPEPPDRHALRVGCAALGYYFYCAGQGNDLFSY